MTGRLAYGRSATSRPGRTTERPGKPTASRRRPHGQRSAICCLPEVLHGPTWDLRQRPPSRSPARPGPPGDRTPRYRGRPGYRHRGAGPPRDDASPGIPHRSGRRRPRVDRRGCQGHRELGHSIEHAGQLGRLPRQDRRGTLDVLEHQHNPAVFVEEPEQPRSWRPLGRRGSNTCFSPVDARGLGVEFRPDRLDESTRPGRCLQPCGHTRREAPGCVTASTTRPPSCCSTAYRNPAGTEGHAIRTPAAGGGASARSPSLTDVPSLAPLIRS